MYICLGCFFKHLKAFLHQKQAKRNSSVDRKNSKLNLLFLLTMIYSLSGESLFVLLHSSLQLIFSLNLIKFHQRKHLVSISTMSNFKCVSEICSIFRDIQKIPYINFELFQMMTSLLAQLQCCL